MLSSPNVCQDVFGYLGIEIRRSSDSAGNLKVTLAQPGLIKKILNTVKDGNLVPIANSQHKPEYTPASLPLGSAREEADFDQRKFGFDNAVLLGS